MFMLAWKKSNCGDMMCQFVICPPPPGGGFFMFTGRQERWRCVFVYSGTPARLISIRYHPRVPMGDSCILREVSTIATAGRFGVC